MLDADTSRSVTTPVPSVKQLYYVKRNADSGIQKCKPHIRRIQEVPALQGSDRRDNSCLALTMKQGGDPDLKCQR